MSDNRIVVFGATGYTGRKTVATLLQRNIRPVIAGRDRNKLEQLSEMHGGLEFQVADVSAPRSVRVLLNPGDILITTVGPFLRHGQAALDAALDAGAHYIDSTGEPSFVRHLVATAHDRAKQRGLIFLPAFGYDYVPGHLAGAAALSAAGPLATRVAIGYFIAPGKKFRRSQGTNASLFAAALDPGLFWRDGRLVEDFGATRWRSFSVGKLTLDAVSIPSSEHLWLPGVYPQLTDVEAYLGWFGNGSRWMSRLSRMNAPLLRVSWISRMLKSLAPAPKSEGDGPSDEELLNSGAHVVALAYDRNGKELARADLVGLDGYNYTARMLACAAKAIADGVVSAAGALGPLQALGYQPLVKANYESGLELSVTKIRGI